MVSSLSKHTALVKLSCKILSVLSEVAKRNKSTRKAQTDERLHVCLMILYSYTTDTSAGDLLQCLSVSTRHTVEESACIFRSWNQLRSSVVGPRHTAHHCWSQKNDRRLDRVRRVAWPLDVRLQPGELHAIGFKQDVQLALLSRAMAFRSPTSTLTSVLSS